MKELSLNVLDIAQNSVKAGAENISILIDEEGPTLLFRIVDDGCGMTEEFLEKVLDPFTTTRTTRKVGLGLPLLKMAAEATGGGLKISSKDEKTHPDDHGTALESLFYTDHIDCPPLGDIVSTVLLLIQNAPFAPRYIFTHRKNGEEYTLDTNELHEQLGDDVPLSEPEILAFLAEFLGGNEAELENSAHKQ